MTYTLPPTPPKKPRRRRLLYVVTAIVLLAGSAVLVLQVLASKSEAAYHAKSQSLRNAGEPVTVAEVCDFGAIPDEQNAAIPLRKAAALVPDLDEPTWRKFDPWPFVVPLSATERDLARQVAGPADQIERLVREAAQLPATHWQLKITGRMIDVLADDPGEELAYRHSTRGDRAQILQVCEMLARGQLPDGTDPDLQARLNLYVRRSGLWDGCGTVIDIYAEVLRAHDAKNWPACKALMPDQERFRGVSNPVLKMLGLTMSPLVQIGKYPYEMRTRRRLARVGLAIHLFTAEHAGVRPRSLDELVPLYLPAIPIDELAADGSGVRYVPGDAALVYSVGEDGIDDGGEPPVMKPVDPNDHSFPRTVRQGGDILFLLTPQPRVEPKREVEENP